MRIYFRLVFQIIKFCQLKWLIIRKKTVDTSYKVSPSGGTTEPQSDERVNMKYVVILLDRLCLVSSLLAVVIAVTVLFPRYWPTGSSCYNLLRQVQRLQPHIALTDSFSLWITETHSFVSIWRRNHQLENYYEPFIQLHRDHVTR